MKKVAFYTLGCKVNQYETNAMIEQFIKKGYEIVNFEEKADIYIINTCTVTNMADRKSRQMLRRVKEINSEAIVVACGCYAQVAKEELEKIPEIDLIYGTNEKNKIADYIENFPLGTFPNGKSVTFGNINNSKVTDVMYQKEFLDFGTTLYTEKTRAVIKVQDGCDRFCSYCIIPYARGHVRSRKVESVIEEIKEIAKEGIKEVVITGIHVASYGKDFKEDIKLIDLLEKVNEIEGIERIRLGSIEPTIITEQFLERLTKLEKICDHFHLSLQSGCDETLKRMNRRYTTEEFRKSTKLLKNAYPNVALTTDIIVGFPGETDEEFEKTYNFLKEIDFYKMHIFKYSQRKGTKAAVMPNQIDGNIKEQRSRRLIELSDENEKRHNEKYIGKKVKVLFEEKEGEYIKGHTTNYMVVKVPYREIENIIEKVKIEKIENLELIGKYQKAKSI
ncbi:MAG: tRNA (N(6)-L-threonylcarbamoyladenosine(37)-C(2))-methylthiotransferase MtaB [Clostridia bacterium]|nr:tRNA (N(6)-L-threonylcarbamoyladenosine(37)-C(2))-methylthiotransferase MtaB [Clostridia bacterium]